MDPLAEKFISHSPYHYTHNNPIKYYDPDGRDIVIHYQEEKRDKNGNVKTYKRGKRKGQAKTRNRSVTYKNGKTYNGNNEVGVNNEFVQNSVAALDHATTLDGGGIINTLANSSKFDANIKQGTANYTPGEESFGTRYLPGSNTLMFDPTGGLAVQNDDGSLSGSFNSPALNLLHELDHNLNFLSDPEGNLSRARTPDATYDNKEERRVIEGSERQGGGTRQNHFGFPYPTTGPTTKQGDFNKIKDQEIRNLLIKKGHN